MGWQLFIAAQKVGETGVPFVPTGVYKRTSLVSQMERFPTAVADANRANVNHGRPVGLRAVRETGLTRGGVPQVASLGPVLFVCSLE